MNRPPRDLYAIFSNPAPSYDDSEGLDEYLDDLRASARKWGRAFCIAVAVFCAVYFGLQLLRGVL